MQSLNLITAIYGVSVSNFSVFSNFLLTETYSDLRKQKDDIDYHSLLRQHIGIQRISFCKNRKNFYENIEVSENNREHGTRKTISRCVYGAHESNCSRDQFRANTRAGCNILQYDSSTVRWQSLTKFD